MEDEIQLEGLVLSPSDLSVPRASWLAQAIVSGRLDFVHLLECRKSADEQIRLGAEIVVISIEVERPQQLAHPIQRFEKLAVGFFADDDEYPLVWSLRRSFPTVPHLNFVREELPRGLCIYAEPWADIRVRWTPAVFLERVRNWLSDTACGTLHREDQPLEGMLPRGAYRLILPATLFNDLAEAASQELVVGLATKDDNCRVLLSGCPADFVRRQDANFVALSVIAPSQKHGTIIRVPGSLNYLDTTLQSIGFDLLGMLRGKFVEWEESDKLKCRLILVIAFPLIRDDHESVEVTDIAGLVCIDKTIREIGIDIGLWSEVDGVLGRELRSNPEKVGANVEVDLVTPQFDLSRSTAAISSGTQPEQSKIVCVGAGALGSQVSLILARSGFGEFTLVDDDGLLPHNLVRHALGRDYIGFNKAFGVSREIKGLYHDANCDWISTNVLKPDVHAKRLNEALASADLILDMAASIPVSRYLTYDVESSARRMSLFLNPRGTDLVAIVEDTARTSQLDYLEMLYYAAIASSDSFSSHLEPPTGRVRYARSCRDVTSALSSHLVAINAAIGAGAVRSLTASEQACIRVWRINEHSLDVRCQEIEVSSADITSINGWTLVVNRSVLQSIHQQRLAKLPSETGGVLIGAYDVPRRIMYVVASLLSPPDSKASPTHYVRGKEGLRNEIQEIERRTSNQIEYLGEWHSHPAGHSCEPSDHDRRLFSYLLDHMSRAGLPALMTIVGDQLSAWHLGEMVHGSGWELQP